MPAVNSDCQTVVVTTVGWTITKTGVSPARTVYTYNPKGRTYIPKGIYIYTLHKLLQCSFELDEPEEGEVKLFYDEYYEDHHFGILLVWLKGEWGTVSDNLWTTENTKILCQQLGRTDGK